MFAFLKRHFKARSGPLRRAVREMLALTFWVHSLFLLNVWNLDRFVTSTAFPQYLFNCALVIFILYYSYVSDKGWLSVAWDGLFVYAYPFIVTKRFISICGRSAWKYFHAAAEFPTLALIPLTANTFTIHASADVMGEPKSDEPTVSDKIAQKGSINLTYFFRPLLNFTILWSLLAFTADSNAVLGFVVFICLVGSARATLALQALLSDTSSWASAIRGTFAKRMAEQISLVKRWQEGTNADEAVQTANVLRLWEVVFAFINQNKMMLARVTWFVAIGITIPFYLYTSYLCGVSYFALAKIQAIAFPFSSAFVDSLYIPFAFTELPKSWLIRGIAGIQAISVTIMGWNAFVRHLSGKFEGLVQAANEFRAPLLDQHLMDQLRSIEAYRIRANEQKR